MMAAPGNYLAPITRQMALTAVLQAIYATGPQRALTVTALHLTNSSAASASANVCLVPAGASPGPGNALGWDFAIPANDFIELGEGLKLTAGMSLYASSVSGNVNLFFSGLEEFDLWNR